MVSKKKKIQIQIFNDIFVLICLLALESTTVRPGFGLYVSCFVCTSRSTSSAEVGFSESSWPPLEDPLPSAGKVGRVWLLGGYETDKTTNKVSTVPESP